MLSVAQLMMPHPALACQNLSALRLIVDQNVSVIQNVQAIWLALIKNAKIHVKEHVGQTQFVK